jgi:hypothetical protein
MSVRGSRLPRRSVQRVHRLVCPRCGSRRISTIEQLAAVARCHAITIDPKGKPRFHWSGWTDVAWDASTTIGLQCDDCLHTETDGLIADIAARFTRLTSRAAATRQRAA